jgi:amino acid transporter
MVPKAMVGTIIINFIAGLLFLVPVCFVLPDLTYLVNLASGQPTPAIFKAAIGNSAGTFCLLVPLLVLGIICGVGCVTATSRCTWAFARDGGIPGSGWWSTVNKSLDIPFNALVLGMVVEIVLGVIYFGSTAAYNAFSGVGVIFLTTSYACPIAVSLIFRGREDIKNGSFNFGVFGLIANVIALGELHLRIPLTHLSFNANHSNYYRLESSCNSTFLHANSEICHQGEHELCLCGVCWLHCYCCHLVCCLGLPQLPWTPN